MIKIHISSSQIIRAKKLYPFDKLNGSITGGDSNIYGALGEIIIYDWFISKGCDVEFNATYDYDMIVDGNKLDIKTKRTTVAPRKNYLCSISAFNTKQQCDGYVFLRIKEDLKTAWILGYEGKKSFFRKATFKKRGEKDINGWRFKDNCYNLEISNLKKFILKNKS